MSTSCGPALIGRFMPVSGALARLVSGLCLAALPTMVMSADLQAFPTKPIRFVLPYAPGGATSVSARILSQKLVESWGQQVLVINQPGGNTTIGADAVARAAPDGYTIMLVTSTHIIAPLLQPVRYDPIRDFTPIAPMNKVETIVAAYPGLPVSNLKDLIALAKSKPGRLNYATSSTGSPPHLAAELFSSMVGIRMQNISYKGGGPAMTDVLGGQVDLMFSNPINLSPHVNSGKLRGIAISGASRAPTMPQVPTFAEGGVAGFNGAFWQGILAPAGLGKPMTDRYAAEIARILAMPDVRDSILNQGAVPFAASPDEFGAVMKADMANYEKIIKAANIKVEQ